ncbi:MAG: HipA domain-containing protein [Lachnospiraceae bacterium]|nr:HipA domain-containing protein [Lachnospiraceae bacterium]
MFTIPTDSHKNKVKKYTIMYEDIPVLEFNRETDESKVYNADLLPFGLKNTKVSAVAIFEWLTNRVDNLNRTYMNMVYIARKVGRDRDKIIKDSSGISFTDNYWIKTRDSIADWNELKKLRDDNIALNNVALTGEIADGENLLSGFTSLFTTKGYFPKAVYGGYIYKLKKDSILEYPVYLIGKQLGIDVAECELENEYVKIKIFTDDNTSLVHASELKTYFDTDDEIYNVFVKDEKYKNIVAGLQRMYIFNYIIANPDLHDDNYGLLYDSKTFEFKAVAPCYDHNVAFQEGFMGLSRTTMGNSASLPLDDLCERFIKQHKDISDNLKTIDLSEVKTYLTDRQFDELQNRIQKAINWAK